MKNSKQNKIRVGVVGTGRGHSFASNATDVLGMHLVAVCDKDEDRLRKVGDEFGVTTYTNYEKFLDHDMDAVVLANYFHEHAPFAIKALQSGKHVMSECTSNATLSQGVELCRAVEKSGKIYMLAENYPYTAFNMEMRRLYQDGELGEATYADGEYNHPMSPKRYRGLSPGKTHWRNWIPPPYYCTHALAPMIYISDRMPIKVNGLSIASPHLNKETQRVADQGSVILCRMDNGAVFRLYGLFLPGHSNWYRLHGTHGAMEVVRGDGYFGTGQVRVWHEEWNCPPNTSTDRSYVPTWPEHADLAEKTGHDGGDFWTSFYFANAIRTGEPPFLDVYRAVAMSNVGILAWRSCLADGAPFDIPDFHDESVRVKYENDHQSPFPSHAPHHQLPPSILGMPPLDESN